MDETEEAGDNAFPREYGLGLSLDDGSAPLLEAIQTAIEALADSDASPFADFLRRAKDLNSMTVQRLIARGLVRIASKQPLLAFDFLTADLRRLMLGGIGPEHADTGALISAVCPYLEPERIQMLEEMIGTWDYMRALKPNLRLDRSNDGFARPDFDFGDSYPSVLVLWMLQAPSRRTEGGFLTRKRRNTLHFRRPGA